MYVFYDSNGIIRDRAISEIPIENYTSPYLNLTALYLDDNQYADVAQNPLWYLIVNNSPVKQESPIILITLDDAKKAKMSEVTGAYQSEVNSTFTSSATGTPLVYNYSDKNKPSAQDIWSDLFRAIDKNLLPSTAFPLPITLVDGTIVNHTQAQIEQIEVDIAMWKFPLYQKFQKLVTSTIPSATTIDEVNAIIW